MYPQWLMTVNISACVYMLSIYLWWSDCSNSLPFLNYIVYFLIEFWELFLAIIPLIDRWLTKQFRENQHLNIEVSDPWTKVYYFHLLQTLFYSLISPSSVYTFYYLGLIHILLDLSILHSDANIHGKMLPFIKISKLKTKKETNLTKDMEHPYIKV